ncbi:MAG: GNAT family N-acetyltransferase [Desulfurococcales archaeon]|nr:GNAT family N-acetyltransferase [Desulfurococcales archaeon]
MRDKIRLVEVHAGNVGIVFGLVRRIYRGFEDVTLDGLRAMVSTGLLSMAVLSEGKPIAFASSNSLPGAIEVRSLAVDLGYGWALDTLLQTIASRLKPLLSGRLFRVVDLGLPSIVSAPFNLGLKPRRRILKIKWILDQSPAKCLERIPEGVVIVKVSDYGDLEEVAKAYLEGLSTHWRWWIDSDMGGYEDALREVRGWIEGDPYRWYTALVVDTVVGAAGYMPHPRLAHIAWLAGVAMKPGYRLQGIGRALLCSVLDSVRGENFREAVVYTFSPIIGLAPGATLYLKTGASIQAEYIHFESTLKS